MEKSAGQSTRDIRILVVEEEGEVCPGDGPMPSGPEWQVETAFTAMDCLSRMRSGSFDVVVLDLGLCDAFGAGLLQEIWTQAPATPVIGLVREPSQASVIQAMKAGVFECLAKPCSAQGLRSVVESALRARSGVLMRTRRFLPGASEPTGICTIRVRPERCWACLSCTVACAFANLGLSEDAPLKPAMLSSARLSVEAAGEYSVPLLCMQCSDAPCMSICPAKALQREDPDSPITVDIERCVGCRRCVLACPLGVLALDETNHVVLKCDMCISRSLAGRLPACVDACPLDALEWVSVREVSSEACAASISR